MTRPSLVPPPDRVCLGLLPSGGASPPTWTSVRSDCCQAGSASAAQQQKLDEHGREGRRLSHPLRPLVWGYSQ